MKESISKIGNVIDSCNSSIDILSICYSCKFIKDNSSYLTKESRKEKLLSIESYRPKISFILSGISLQRTKKTRSICITSVDIINVPNIVQLYILAYSLSNTFINVLHVEEYLFKELILGPKSNFWLLLQCIIPLFNPLA